MNFVKLFLLFFMITACKQNIPEASAPSAVGSGSAVETKSLTELQAITHAYQKASFEECNAKSGAIYLGSNLCVTDRSKLEDLKLVLFTFIEEDVSKYKAAECTKAGGLFGAEYCFLDLGSVGEIFRERVSSLSEKSMSLWADENNKTLLTMRFVRGIRCSAKYFGSLFREWASCAKQGKAFDHKCGQICIPDGQGGFAKCPCTGGTPDYWATVDSTETWQLVNVARDQCRGEFENLYRLVWVDHDKKTVLGTPVYANSCYAVWKN
jgi:hypothetical protein